VSVISIHRFAQLLAAQRRWKIRAMVDHLPAEPEPQPQAAMKQWRLKVGELLLQGSALLTTITALGWLLAPWVRNGAIPLDWLPQALLCFAAILTVAAVMFRSFRCWTAPTRQLCRLLPAIGRGEMPIGSIGGIDGGLRPLVPVLESLLQDLRRQRGELKKLEGEMRQRVANRTDALERAIGSLQQKASRDGLTGLYNRRMLDEHLPQLVERRKARSPGMCLLMMDIDHFKLLNDTLGHAAGDELLRSIGQLIRSSIREGDMAFRCGGDEFVVVLDDCGADDGHVMAERLISLVDGLTRTLHVPLAPRLSVGVCRLSDLDDPSPKALLEKADRLLYEVKAARKAALGLRDSRTR
jgi:diguanylate cyclase (GGDEF)-like protein